MKSLVLTFIVTAICALCSPLTSIADETFAIHGTLSDAETHKPIAGASIRVLGSRKGTYSGINGFFRIPMPKGNYTIEVKSLGYSTQTFSVSESAPQVNLSLKNSPVGLRTVQVTADISAEMSSDALSNGKKKTSNG
jgi:iron complex outermembrane receptor protein